MLCGLAITLFIYGVKTVGAPFIAEGMSRWHFNEILGNIFNTAMVLLGISIFLWVYRYAAARRLQNLLAPCGRMSLTLYVSQSLVCVPIFYGFGLGWYAEATQLSALLFGVVLWFLQMLLAHVWFRHFVYGPLEWLWRAATLLRTDIPFLKVAR